MAISPSHVRGAMALGVVPAAMASSTDVACNVGYMCDVFGDYWNRGAIVRDADDLLFAGYGTGDFITVCLNLDAKTVAFRKNGADVGAPQSIAEEGGAFHFAFESEDKSEPVTIVEESE